MRLSGEQEVFLPGTEVSGTEGGGRKRNNIFQCGGKDMNFNSLIPELTVTDVEQTQRFYVEVP